MRVRCLSFYQLGSYYLMIDCSLVDPNTVGPHNLWLVSLLIGPQKLLHKETLFMQLLVRFAKWAKSRKVEKFVIFADNKHLCIIDWNRIDQTIIRQGRIKLPFEFRSSISISLCNIRIHGKHQPTVHNYSVYRYGISFFNAVIKFFPGFPFFKHLIFVFLGDHLHSFTDARQFHFRAVDWALMRVTMHVEKLSPIVCCYKVCTGINTKYLIWLWSLELACWYMVKNIITVVFNYSEEPFVFTELNV